ncbi:putative helix-turn-helix transcriptional regulator [Candidatus Hepatincolaceae symbiont of Richtersius coronifer]
MYVKGNNKIDKKMDLKSYLETTGTTQEEFAEKIIISRLSINRYCNKNAFPRLFICRKIEEATEGQ